MIKKQFCSQYEELYQQLSYLEAGNIFAETGCFKPCSYREYRFIGESQTTSFGAADFVFSLSAVSNDTTLEREVLFYT